MAEWRSYCWLFLGLCLIFGTTGNKERKHFEVLLQNMCFDGIESNFTLPLQTGRQLKYWATSDYFDFIDCRITLTSGKEWIGLVWRDMTILPDEQTMPDCERAFVELSTPNSRLHRFCGRLQDIPAFHQRLEFPNHIDITLRLFVNFSTPWLPTTVITSTSAVANASGRLNVGIILDFTAFTYCSSPGPQDFVCHQSERCIDKSLRCNEMLNCVSPAFPVDTSDETRCIEPPSRSLLLDLMPLWVTLGALGGFLVAYWCFYKPGYLPWRLARIRNARCCGRRGSSVENQRRCFNCCSRSHDRSVSPIIKSSNPELSGKFSTAYNENVQVTSDSNNFNYQAATVNWMDIKYEDGNHQRELR